MGNCLLGGLGEAEDDGAPIKVIKSDGGVLEFYAPVTAGCVTDEFSGHAIFPAPDHLFWKPLCHDEDLVPGQSYYLLPISPGDDSDNNTFKNLRAPSVVKTGHVRSNSIPAVTPYRMSFDYNKTTLKRSYTDVFSRHPGKTRKESNTSNKRRKNSGFWKVKLVIDPEKLLKILSQDGTTNDLIESVRAVAKCGNGGYGAVSSSCSSSYSDQWSLSSSRNASSKKDFSMLDI